ncbi:hypothetical protein [uncultured Microscilla sp.]|uniref:hypothetical protein n=1 Tax=uncultured Microscilla sp. TaxID=432653 RepID=UPI002607D972|nr:hypothetical protein [uncultured Microscilla sp.]
MKKIYISLLLLLCSVGAVHAQRVGDITQGTLNELTMFDNRVKQLYGTYYFQKEWSKGKLVIIHEGKVKTFNDYPIRYDLGNQHIEMKVRNGLVPNDKQQIIKIIDDKYLKVFQFINSKTKKVNYFERCADYKTEKPLPGFFEVLHKGKKASLLKYTTTYVQKGNEMKTLGIGSRDERIQRKVRYYLSKGSTTFKIKRRKKAILKALTDKQTEVKAYAKKNKLYFAKVDDLVKIIAHYNSLQ